MTRSLLARGLAGSSSSQHRTLTQYALTLQTLAQRAVSGRGPYHGASLGDAHGAFFVAMPFSIFIPVWNDQCWLGGAIESVLAQSYPDWELVIGDNASDEDLRSVVEAYTDPRIRYWRWPTHTDLFANFNRTMQLCSGEWLQLLSADVRLHPPCPARMAAAIGIWLMFCTPPATTRSAVSLSTACAANTMRTVAGAVRFPTTTSNATKAISAALHTISAARRRGHPTAAGGTRSFQNTTADANPAVMAAGEHGRGQELTARGDHKGWHPSVDLGAQYAVLSRFNNYQSYFQPGSFVRKNATVGGVIRFPFLNAPQKARAQGADADALKARKQAEAVRNQVSEATLRLQRSVAQMQAAREVAELEYEIAQKNVVAVQTRMDSSGVNLHDLDDARAQATERFITLQDMSFELERSEIELLRATGELESWAMGTK